MRPRPFSNNPVSAATEVTIPAFVNPGASRVRPALEALNEAPGFEVRQLAPDDLSAALRDAVSHSVPRVLIAGGDGTVALAASVLADTPVALAVLPAGTLNHFARDHQLPLDPGEALQVARQGTVRGVDIGYVNRELFVNTSSVGVYVRFVRTRDRLEPFCGYWLASVLAGLRIIGSIRSIRVALHVAGRAEIFTAPLVFVGIGERKLTLPGLGEPIPGGEPALHVVVPRGRRQARHFMHAYARSREGLPVESRLLGLDSVLVDRLRVDLPARSASVALDGEIRRLSVPLEYRLARGALKLAC